MANSNVHAEPAGIEAEDDHDGYDSGYDTLSSTSSTASLTESLYNFQQKYGRTYAAAKGELYPFPNDEIESDRLDLQHHLFRLIFDDKLYISPISPLKGRVLDVGTGTGLWPIELADSNPAVEVLGFDISPIQPRWVPPNLSFEIYDANEDWNFHSEFDFIHARYLHMAVEEKKLFQQAFDTLKPGGWFEMKETPFPILCDDGTLEGTALQQWGRDMEALGTKAGLDFRAPWHYEEWMKDAGFVNVSTTLVPLPTSRWPKDKKLKLIGQIQQIHFADQLEGISIKLFCDVGGYSEAQVRANLVEVRKDILNRNIHAYFNNHAIIAQKPLSA